MTKTFRHLFFHHTSNNHKPRVLHVEGVVLCVLIAVFSQVMVRSFSVGHGPLPAILGFSSSIQADEVVSQTNSKRRQSGLGDLVVNSSLVSAALAKGNDMCARQYWAHISPSGTTPWVFMKDKGYRYAVAGENLARDFADTASMVSAWMASPTHKANIVNPKYKEIGIAVVNCNLLGTDTALVVQMFGTQLTAQSAGKTASGAKTGSAAQVKAIETQVPSEQGAVPAVAGQESVPSVISDSTPTLLLEEAPSPTSPAVPVFTPMQTQKAFVVAILLLVGAVLCIDMWVVEKRNLVRISSRSLGHFLFLSGIFIVVLLVQAGTVL